MVVRSIDFEWIKSAATNHSVYNKQQIPIENDSISHYLKNKDFDIVFAKVSNWSKHQNNHSKQVVYLSLFDKLFKQGDYPEALYFLRKTEIIMGDSYNELRGDIYLRYGKLLNLKNKPEKALKYYGKALIFYEKSSDENYQNLIERQELALISMSQASYNLGKIKTAFAWANEAVKINPGIDSCLNLIELWLNGNQVQKAIRYFERLKDYELNESQGIKLRVLKAQLFLVQHKYELAKDILGRLIQNLENDTAKPPIVLRDLYYLLSHIHSALGENMENELCLKYYQAHNAKIVKALAKIPSSILIPLTMDGKRQLTWARYSIILIIITCGVFLYMYWKRINSRILEKQRLINRQSHTLNSQRLTIAALEKELNDPLIGLLHSAKTNDPGFLTLFYEVYPEVFDKLISLEPKLIQTELAFCAMVWLNFSTKEIARYTYVQPKSVQMKKHRLRKKLEIDSDQDLYVWFRKL